MAKISPVSIKYMIHANFMVEGALEKPDVIGAIFGQTEGLLGADLEMRDLQKEGKIGRIEVDLKREGKQTIGNIKIPTALDQSETTLIAAAVETIERIGPCDSQIEVEKIEDVRGSKRDYILERAKKLMVNISGSSNSREISNAIKDSSKISEIKEYGNEKLPCGGDISGKELIVVEGRADVINLLRSGIKNTIGMNGTKLPSEIKELGKEKEITLFVDGDRGGKLIAQNVVDNANVKYIAVAPDGKEVEELSGKEVLMCLRKKVSVEEFFGRRNNRVEQSSEKKSSVEAELSDDQKEKLKKIFNEISGTGKAILLDYDLNSLKSISVRGLNISLRKTDDVMAVVMDGTVTSGTISAAEEKDVKVIVAKNFSTTDTNIKLLSL
jgi:DNA primase